MKILLWGLGQFERVRGCKPLSAKGRVKSLCARITQH